jgi:hypothetical protein
MLAIRPGKTTESIAEREGEREDRFVTGEILAAKHYNGFRETADSISL